MIPPVVRRPPPRDELLESLGEFVHHFDHAVHMTRQPDIGTGLANRSEKIGMNETLTELLLHGGAEFPQGNPCILSGPQGPGKQFRHVEHLLKHTARLEAIHRPPDDLVHRRDEIKLVHLLNQRPRGFPREEAAHALNNPIRDRRVLSFCGSCDGILEKFVQFQKPALPGNHTPCFVVWT